MRATHRAHVGRKPVRRATLSVGLTVAGCLLTVPAAAATPPAYDYVVTGEVHETHEATGTDGDVGLCSPPRRPRSTTGRSRSGSARAWLDSPTRTCSPSASRSPTAPSAAPATSTPAVWSCAPAAHTYTLRYTGQDTARVHGYRVTFDSRFVALGHSETGARYSIRQSGRLVLVGGAPRIDRERLVVLGVPAMSWLTALGAWAGVLAGALGLSGFGLVLLAPHGDVERAADPTVVERGSARVGERSACRAVSVRHGRNSAAVPRRTGRLGGRGREHLRPAATHTRVLVDYAAFGIDADFAARLHDTQTPLAEALFAVIAVVAAASWIAVATTVARPAGYSRAGRVAVGVAGLGIMLSVPLTAVALLVASAGLLRRESADSGASRPVG